MLVPVSVSARNLSSSVPLLPPPSPLQVARDDAREEEGKREGGRDLGRNGGEEDKNVLYVAVAEPLICLPASAGALS